jgi:uncharacterized protein involved in cysteine biosynthesis
VRELLRGIRAFFSGFHFILTTPGIWGFAAIPVLVATLLIGGFMALGVWGAGAAASAVFGEPSGDWGEAGLFATRIFFYVLAALIAILAGMVLAQPISSPALDRIALLAAWDLIDYPFSLRGADVQARFTWMKRNFAAAFGFGAMIALVALVPFLGLLMLPVGVAGATKLIFVGAAATRARGVPM